MIAGGRFNDKAFKRALTISAAAHALLFAFLIINPAFPKKATPKGVIHYLSLGRGGGGRPAGGPGGGGVKAETTAPAKAESLRDLTTPDKAKPKPESKLRYPVDEAKNKRKQVPAKKASISPPAPGTKTGTGKTAGGTSSTAGGEGGSGLTIGPGGTGAGEGGMFGDGFGDGLADFPYAYYLGIVQDKIQVNWFLRGIDPGPDNVLQTLVYFRIYRNGTISTVDIKQTSGILNFDINCRRAVANAAPFPPLPADYEGEYLGINLLFEHKR